MSERVQFDTYEQFEEAFSRLSPDAKFWLEALIECRMNRAAAASKLGRKMEELTLLLNTDLIFRVMFNYYAEAIQATQDDIKQLLTDQATADYTRYLHKETVMVADKFGEMEAVRYWTMDIEAIKADGKGHLVKKISYDKQGRMTVEFYDSQRAAQLLMNTLGMNRTNNQPLLPHGFNIAELNQDQLQRLSTGVSDPFELWREVEFERLTKQIGPTSQRHSYGAASESESEVFDLTRLN